MTEFHNISFPLPLAFGASGGPSRRIDITQLASGAEHRNTAHAQSRRRYNAGAGLKTVDEVYDLIEFFEARLGQLYSFRYRDPIDYKSRKPNEIISSTDQIIGRGDGMVQEFQLIKTYSDAAGAYERLITKPVLGSVKIAIDGAEISSSKFTVNELTGVISFNTAPSSEAVISAGFEFDVPVRFDTEQLDVSLEAFGAGQVINVPLIEVLHHA